MAVNLLRNTRALFTTNVDASTGVVANSGFTNANTFEIQILEGYSFSQNTTTETVTLSEAGPTPNRGQRMFNTALEPADFSFSTYIRPYDADGTGVGNVSSEDTPLWKAFTGDTSISSGSDSPLTFDFLQSNTHQLAKCGIIFLVDSVAFIIDNVAFESATVDFGIDAISSVAWAGKGTALRRIEGVTASAGTIGGGTLSGAYLEKMTAPGFLANKLSTASISSGISTGGTTYSVALTGGSITFANNLSYLTPANLGVVNKPATYFTGTRSITGTMDMYLRTGGTNDTSDLLNAILTDASTSPAYRAAIDIGGSSATTKVTITLPAIVPSVPSVSADQVISMSVTFTGQGYSGSAFDIEQANEATIVYQA